MSESVISVENLGKKYIIGHQQQTGYTTLRDSISNSSRKLLQTFQNKPESHSNTEEFWALNNVSFDIQQGDRVGIIGRNGAGKSTLLKVLSRITEPSTGSIRISGRVASLLEVGTGFHPELTGRENIFLNGAILGMEKAEIQRKFDEIVDFSEVEKFLDTPVKRYSSGMYVRLAFAVAAHMEPEILIVDEVLAVGDSGFQKKCLGKMKDVGKDGRTVLFVSHNMAAINSLCTTGIVLNKGRVIRQGSISECISEYELHNSQGQSNIWVRPADLGGGSLTITSIKSAITGEQPNLTLELNILLESSSDHKAAFLAVDIFNANGTALMQAIPDLTGFIHDTEATHSINVAVRLPPLIPDRYLVGIWVGSHNTQTLDEVKEVVMFEIHESPTKGRSFPHHPQNGYVVPMSTAEIVRSPE